MPLTVYIDSSNCIKCNTTIPGFDPDSTNKHTQPTSFEALPKDQAART